MTSDLVCSSVNGLSEKERTQERDLRGMEIGAKIDLGEDFQYQTDVSA
jgi:hypothetical protein